MTSLSLRQKLLGSAVALAIIIGGGSAVLLSGTDGTAKADSAAATLHITPVSVATVEQRDLATWNEFSGRLEAVERVDVRSRVAGAVESVHFREGALVREGDLLVTIDPAPYAAEVERTKAQVAATEARVKLTKGELERGRNLLASGTISQRELDVRVNAYNEAQASLRAAQAGLQYAKLNLSYTEVRAPVSGRVGKLEITVGNLVPAGAGAPVLTTLVSVSPIYASFEASEHVVLKALGSLPATAGNRGQIDQIPVQMGTVSDNGTPLNGKLQLVDNAVNAATGTVRVRAVFENADGNLIPGQFARLKMGSAKTETAIVISDRAVGTDQDKKFVLIVGKDNKVDYREVRLGGLCGWLTHCD